jgi:hypothetical protein
VPRCRREFSDLDVRIDGWNTTSPPKTNNRAGDISKLGMVRTNRTGGLGPQTDQFKSMRSMSPRTRNFGGNSLTRERLGQDSRIAVSGMATPPNVTSNNSFEHAHPMNFADG